MSIAASLHLDDGKLVDDGELVVHWQSLLWF